MSDPVTEEQKAFVQKFNEKSERAHEELKKLTQSKQLSPKRHVSPPVPKEHIETIRKLAEVMLKKASEEEKAQARKWIYSSGVPPEIIQDAGKRGYDIAIIAFHKKAKVVWERSQQVEREKKKKQMQERISAQRASFSKDQFEEMLNTAALTQDQRNILLTAFQEKQLQKLLDDDMAAKQAGVGGQQAQSVGVPQQAGIPNNPAAQIEAIQQSRLGSPFAGTSSTTASTPLPRIMPPGQGQFRRTPQANHNLGSGPSSIQGFSTPTARVPSQPSSAAQHFPSRPNPLAITGPADPVTLTYPGNDYHYSYAAMMEKNRREAEERKKAQAQAQAQAEAQAPGSLSQSTLQDGMGTSTIPAGTPHIGSIPDEIGVGLGLDNYSNTSNTEVASSNNGQQEPLHSSQENTAAATASGQPTVNNFDPIVRRVEIGGAQPNINALLHFGQRLPYQSPYGTRDFGPSSKAQITGMKQIQHHDSDRRPITPPNEKDFDKFQGGAKQAEYGGAPLVVLPDTPPPSTKFTPAKLPAVAPGVVPLHLPDTPLNSAESTPANSANASATKTKAKAKAKRAPKVDEPQLRPLNPVNYNVSAGKDASYLFLMEQIKALAEEKEAKRKAADEAKAAKAKELAEEKERIRRRIQELDEEDDALLAIRFDAPEDAPSVAKKAKIAPAAPSYPRKKTEIEQFLFPGDEPVVYHDEKFPGSYIYNSEIHQGEWNPTLDMEEEFEDWKDARDELESSDDESEDEDGDVEMIDVEEEEEEDQEETEECGEEKEEESAVTTTAASDNGDDHPTQESLFNESAEVKDEVEDEEELDLERMMEEEMMPEEDLDLEQMMEDAMMTED